MDEMRTLVIGENDLLEIQEILDEYADVRGQSMSAFDGGTNPASRLRGFRIFGLPYREPKPPEPLTYPMPEDVWLPRDWSSFSYEEVRAIFRAAPARSDEEADALAELLRR